MSSLVPIPGFAWAFVLVIFSAVIQMKWPNHWWLQLILLFGVAILKWWDVFGPFPGNKQGLEPTRHYVMSLSRGKWERFFLG